MYLVSWKIY